MKSLVCLSALCLLLAVTAQEAEQETQTSEPCPVCLYPLWYLAQTLTDEELCSTVKSDDVVKCLDNCNPNAEDKPKSYLIRQLTQFSDIFYSLRNNSCAIDSCDEEILNCVDMAANFENEDDGSRAHAPHNTVFNYNCSSVEQSLECVGSVSEGCYGNSTRLEAMAVMFSSGLSAACFEPRRCVSYGKIFEVKPGTECKEYYEEAAAYGPSLDAASVSYENLGFDPSQCVPEFLDQFTCPPDPEVLPIYSEFPPTEAPPPKTEEELDEEQNRLADITVDLDSPCEQCLQPVWERLVSFNGTYMCQERVTSLVVDCLQSCKDKTVLRDQLHTEVLAKIADINKVLSLNGCQEYPGCTSDALACTEGLVNFYPLSAPYVTVNSLVCQEEELNAAAQCFSDSCAGELGETFANFIRLGYSPICQSANRCLSYGSIFEYAAMSELSDEAEKIPCAYYRQAPAHRWHVSAVARVQPGLLFNTEKCQPDWPAEVTCPTDVSN